MSKVSSVTTPPHNEAEVKFLCEVGILYTFDKAAEKDMPHGSIKSYTYGWLNYATGKIGESQVLIRGGTNERLLTLLDHWNGKSDGANGWKYWSK